MAKKVKRVLKRSISRRRRVPLTKAHEKELRVHSKARTPVAKLVRLFKRTDAALRQKALTMGIALGHRR